MSWTVPSYAELNPVCTLNCTAQNDTFDCPEGKMEIAELGCGEIYHKPHGPFQVTIFRRMAENGFAPPPLGNFADISYLVEN